MAMVVPPPDERSDEDDSFHADGSDGTPSERRWSKDFGQRRGSKGLVRRASLRGLVSEEAAHAAIAGSVRQPSNQRPQTGSRPQSESRRPGSVTRPVSGSRRPGSLGRQNSRPLSGARRGSKSTLAASKRASVAVANQIKSLGFQEEEGDVDEYSDVDSDDADDLDIPVHRPPIMGLLVDFLIRLNPVDESLHPHDHVHRHMGISEPIPTHQHQWSGYMNAIETVNHEMLFSAILEDVTVFWKVNDPVGWGHEYGTFAKRAKEICKIKQQVMCIRVDVHNWMFRHRLLKGRGAIAETQQERHDRHQEFWAQFHEMPRKLEVVSPTRASPRLHSPGRACPRLDQKHKPKKAVQDHVKGLDVKSKTTTDSQWKTRSARSRCSAGAWDWSRGTSTNSSSKFKSRPATASSFWHDETRDTLSDMELDSTYASQSTHTSPKSQFNHRWWQAHQPEPAVVSPFVNRSKGFPTALSDMKKATSLPHIPGLRSPRGARMAHGSIPEQSAGKAELARRSSLPPIAGAFVVPWQGRSPVPTLKCEETPTKRYLCSVQAEGSLPRPLPFITGHSLKFTAGEQSLCDKDLASVVDMMPGMSIKEVDLSGNLLLSEKALLRFMDVLVVPPAPAYLEQVNLKRCMSAGQKVMDMFISMISDGCHNLTFLNLSGIPIGTRRHLPLARAVGSHPSLEKLDLADTGLGGSPHPELCIQNLLQSTTITSLDLGWNCFSEEVFSLFGDQLCKTDKLQQLMLANCSSAGKASHATPMCCFIEHLSRDKSLKYLDISLNRIDFRAALVLEDALESHKRLREINMSHNPLGFLGMRSILRLLSRNSSGLESFSCDDCSSGKTSESNEVYQVFSATNPSGRYTLELVRPYHRSILRMLYKTCDRYSIAPEDAFSDIQGTPSYVHPARGSDGLWDVPATGRLSATFSIDKAVVRLLSDINEWDFTALMEKYMCIMRVEPGYHKAIPLLAQWKSIDGHMLEQRTFLNALSKDFLIQYPYIEQMAQNRGMLSEILSQLMPCIKGGQVTRFLSMLLLPSLGEYVICMKRYRTLFSFNLENPNGHYLLDLESVADHAVAERLLVLDRWETTIAKRLGRVDTSQKGNYSQIRNEKYQHRPIQVATLMEWNLPEHYEMEFDYSSGKRPPPDALPIDALTFSSILVTLQNSDCSAKEQIQALQMASHMIYLQAVQMRGLLGIYAEESVRVNLFVLFFLRVVDYYNEKVYRVRFENQKELDILADRLGYVTLFPFIQPEQTQYCYDFSFYEQRLAANIILALGGTENKANLRNPVFMHPDGTFDPLPLGIPRAWETFDKMPKGGKLSVSYVCSPEDRDYKLRRKYYETYGYRVAVPEEDVMWWAALNMAPEDVLEYVSFLVTRYNSPMDAFIDIDGVDGNGVLTLREFEEGYKEMECKKFAGSNEKQRVHAVFRYLDPSGEGQVSKCEWELLELLWKEIKLSITEFVQFCERTFGDDLAETWQFMDEDGGGEIDMPEWCKACTDCGYFGPVVPIFGFLDADDEGTISYDEFEALEKFQAPPEERHRATLARVAAEQIALTPAELCKRKTEQAALSKSSSQSTLFSRPTTPAAADSAWLRQKTPDSRPPSSASARLSKLP